ncbi:MAG: RNA pseudouridine synthase [Saprospiraceae bacterium]|nr:RNA pseudouridine synthase [Saprospiraceae bacterium]
MIDFPHINMGEILCYKTNQFLAFNKPNGIPVQSKEGRSLHHFANAYAKRPLHLIHRIDQPVSGLVLFGRNAKAAASISEQFSLGQVQRKYFAVVADKPDVPEGSLHHFLVHNKKVNKSIVADTSDPEAKECRLDYRFLRSSESYHLIEISLETGRHHQVRAQLAEAGMFIKGDVKYGARRANKDRSIHLHAAEMQFRHPVSGEVIKLVAPCPDEVLWKALLE